MQMHITIFIIRLSIDIGCKRWKTIQLTGSLTLQALLSMKVFSKNDPVPYTIINPSCPDLGQRKKINLKAFIKPIEAPQRRMKIKI